MTGIPYWDMARVETGKIWKKGEMQSFQYKLDIALVLQSFYETLALSRGIKVPSIGEIINRAMISVLDLPQGPKDYEYERGEDYEFWNSH